MGLRQVVDEVLDSLEGDIRRKLAAETEAVQTAVDGVEPVLEKLRAGVEAAVKDASQQAQADAETALAAGETALRGLFTGLL
jgi:hypothetical protein